MLAAPRIFINVGGRAVVPDMPGIDDVPYLDQHARCSRSTGCREHLVVVGGSYIGLEFAQMYRRFGAEVTVVEKGAAADRAARTRTCREPIREILEREGIAVRTGAECIALRAARATASRVGVDCATGAPEVVGSHVLLAVGRRAEHRRPRPRPGRRRDRRARLHPASTSGLAHQRARHLGAGRLQRPRRLHPHRLQRLRDRRRQPARRRASASVSDRIPAYALYIDPPLGRVGMTETRGAREPADRSWSARAR